MKHVVHDDHAVAVIISAWVLIPLIALVVLTAYVLYRRRRSHRLQAFNQGLNVRHATHTPQQQKKPYHPPR